MKHLVNLKSYLNFLSHNKLYTFIEILGLSVAFTFVVIITIYSIQEFSKDNFHQNGEHIYALANEDNFSFTYQLGEQLQERYPEIEKVCALNNQWGIAVSSGDKSISADVILADSTFFDLFSFKLSSGNRENALQRKNYAIISETFANKMFPDSNALGQILEVGNGLHVVVNGVMSDIKNSAVRYRDILLRMDNIEYLNPDIQRKDYGNMPAVIFMLLKEGTTLYPKQTEIADYLRKTYLPYQQDLYSTVNFIPIKDIYFSMLHKGGGLLEEGDRLYVQIVIMIGCLVLIFAIINYVNLTVAQNGFRAREMATRQLLGSSRTEMFVRLILETFILTLAAFSLAVFLSYLCAPYAGRLLQTTIYISDYLTAGVFLSMLFFVLVFSILVGCFPALLLSRAKAVDIVKGKFRQETKMVFSKFFITFQHLITCTLVGCAIIVIWQTQYMIHAPLGYNTKDIINLPVSALDKEKRVILANELNQLGGVKRIAFSEGTPFNYWDGFQAVYEGAPIYFPYLVVDSTFIDMLEIQVLKENNLSHPDGFYFSEYAVNMLGIDPDLPVLVTDEKHIPVAGVVKDIQLHNTTNSLLPVLIQIRKAEDFPNGIRYFSIETQGDPFVAFQDIKERYEEFSGLEFSGDFIENQIEQSFYFFKQMSSLITLFAFITTVLSLLGLLAMSTYFIQQRIKEIAIRKVFGSTNPEILHKLLYTFLSYVLIAFVLAAPLIWLIGDLWLSEHRYRISLSPTIFILTALFCCTIALFTVVWQSYTAANLNPAETIKNE